MDSKLTGAWCVHHSEKLKSIGDSTEFDAINFSGKCGKMLSALSASEKSEIEMSKVQAISKSLGLSQRSDLKPILEQLKAQRLIEYDDKKIYTLGLTSMKVLDHTGQIFEEQEPSNFENAAIDVCEITSNSPKSEKLLIEELSDKHKVDRSQTKDLLKLATECGFIDSESVTSEETLYFNGYIFRKETPKNMAKVLDTLKPAQQLSINQVDDMLRTKGCLEEDTIKKILGEDLFKKLIYVGIYEINSVSNGTESINYITKPSSFNKFGNSIIEDAFDLARAFVASLTYGMERSEHGRGQIRLIEALMRKLIRGEYVGPATAIGHDYKILEVKRVVEIIPQGKMYKMRLLKKEVGEIALQVITQGEAVSSSAMALPGVSLDAYVAPEVSRLAYKKKNIGKSFKESRDILLSLRTGK